MLEKMLASCKSESFISHYTQMSVSNRLQILTSDKYLSIIYWKKHRQNSPRYWPGEDFNVPIPLVKNIKVEWQMAPHQTKKLLHSEINDKVLRHSVKWGKILANHNLTKG